jgi:superfamily II DNA or RNA helicase
VTTLSALIRSLHDDPLIRGKQFERICKWYLINDPVYGLQLRRVWLWGEWPGRWGADAGIDLVAEEHNGRLWAIQAKAYNSAYSITKADVDSFLSESGRPQFAFRLLIATTNRIGKTAERTLRGQEKPAGCLLLADLRAAHVAWPRSPLALQPAKPRPKRSRPHQRQAIAAVVKGFEQTPQGQMIMACGTGKTLTALFIREQLAAKRTLVLVPSLSLLSDTLREWTANGPNFQFLPVCSDDTVTDDDAAVSTTTDLGFPVTTDPREIASFLRRRSGSQVVFSTYQSSPRIAEAFRMGRVPAFDLVIADEAHRCTGRVSSDFATVLDSAAIPTRRRLFMTATPRFFTGRVGKEAMEADFEVASMDDESRFGPVFHRLGFAEAIERGLLSDYQVVIVGVDDATYLDWAQRRRFVTIDGTTVTDAWTLAGQIGLAKAMRRYDLRRTISFHSRVSGASKFAHSMPQLVDWMPAHQRPKGRLWSHFASGEMSAGQRSILLDHLRHLADEERGLLANARCLGEGIDVPALDGVAFIDPRRSEVDIVQAVGRAIRLAEDKKVGTIVIPVFIETGDDPDTALDGSVFKPVWDVLKALRAHDDDLAEQLDELRRSIGRGASSITPPKKVRFDLPASVNPDFASAFNVRLVEETTRIWEFWFGLMEAYIVEHGHSRIPKEEEFRGFKLGSWAAVQRVLQNNGNLSPERIEHLSALPGWAWNMVDDYWERGFQSLMSFVRREGHADVPVSCVENGFRLGQWVNINRTRYSRGKIDDPERIKRLENVPGWMWNVLDARWDRGFTHLVQHGKREGHLQVPVNHIDNDGFALGTWVSNQRHSLRSSPDSERHQRLAKLKGWTWDPFEDRWGRSYLLLQAYAERVGDSLVPQSYLVDGLNLGQWVSHHRVLYQRGQLSQDRVQLLEAVPGWAWNVNDALWEEGYRRVLAFAKEHGDSRVPVDYIEQDYSLGQWARVQRVSYKDGQLEPQRIARLEALPGWTWDPYTTKWDQGFDALVKYVAREGNARVRVDHVEGNFRLGNWTQNQRGFYRRKKLSPERIERLEALPGWAWTLPKGPRSATHHISGTKRL